MRVRVDGLFRHDLRGRTVTVNQWDGGEPPRFHLARTSRGNVCRIRWDVPDDRAETLVSLAHREPPLDDPQRAPRHAAEYVRVLCSEVAGARIESGPVYWFAETVSPTVAPLVVDRSNADVLRGGLESWLPDVPYRQPLVAIIEHGRAVSVCASVRITALAHEAGVETLAGHRRRGHAVNAVAGWSQEARARGITTLFYSTSWANLASRGVASRLGLTFIGADFSVH